MTDAEKCWKRQLIAHDALNAAENCCDDDNECARCKSQRLEDSCAEHCWSYLPESHSPDCPLRTESVGAN